MKKERLYHLVAINEKGKIEVLTSYPDSHRHCMTMKSKFTPHKNVRIQVVEKKIGVSIG
jgi:hypothetical protein